MEDEEYNDAYNHVADLDDEDTKFGEFSKAARRCLSDKGQVANGAGKVITKISGDIEAVANYYITEKSQSCLELYGNIAAGAHS